MSDWISVEDKLPELGQYCIIYDPVGQMNPANVIVGQYTKHGFTAVYNPDFWMPLPEPPKTK